MKISLVKIETLLRLEDIEGLIEIHGAPEDEYNSEAEEIAEALEDVQLTEEKIVAITASIWMKMFNLDQEDIVKRMPAFRNFARSLLLSEEPR